MFDTFGLRADNARVPGSFMDVARGRRRLDKLIARLNEVAAAGAGDPVDVLRALQSALGESDTEPSREGWGAALQRVIDRLAGAGSGLDTMAATGLQRGNSLENTAPGSEPPDTCRHIVSAIAARYHEPHLKLADLAADTHLSPWHVTRLLKRHTGRGFSSYLRDLRVAEAQRLLGERTLSAKEIAAAVGFSSASHFTRQFKQACGVTPVAFRDRSPDRPRPPAGRKNRQAIASSGKT